jgi:hypothetical protein
MEQYLSGDTNATNALQSSSLPAEYNYSPLLQNDNDPNNHECFVGRPISMKPVIADPLKSPQIMT